MRRDRGDAAVVLGGSIAGLLAAHVLRSVSAPSSWLSATGCRMLPSRVAAFRKAGTFTGCWPAGSRRSSSCCPAL
ncbi:MAG TPA: hypothetical protein VIT65_05645, partial [Microlunatus sp.]